MKHPSHSKLSSCFFLFSSFVFSGSPITQESIVKNKEGMDTESLAARSHVSWAAFFVLQLRIPLYLSSKVALLRTSTILFALFVVTVFLLYF